jgi:AcrR family transcriptional regulator
MTAAAPRGSDTRQALIDAALDVFLQRGFARATTREIAQTAGVAEGTIYRHFPDKHALFHEVFRSLTGDIVDELRRLPERAGHGTVRDNLEYLFALVGGMQARLSSLMASIWADPELARNFGAHVREHAAEGFEPPDPVSMVAEYVRAEQELGRIRADVNATEAAATVVSVPFAAGMERALRTHLPAPGDLPVSGGFPTPGDFPMPAAGALDILARGLAPAAEAPAGDAPR